MNVVVTPEITQKYPALRIGFASFSGLDNGGEDKALVERTVEAEARFRARFPSVEALGEDPRISLWREVYKSFGAKPNRFRPSAEALLRRVAKGDGLPWVNKAVNAYLLAQLEIPLPVGGYDLDRVSGDITLAFSPGGEPFDPIGGERETTDAGEVVYRDDARILTRRWNFRDCDAAKITPESRRVALFVEAPVEAVSTEEMERLVAALRDNVLASCGGTAQIGSFAVAQRSSAPLS